jgi:hypothetical protein
MRASLVIIAVILCLINTAFSQDTIENNYEFGSVIVTHRYSSLVFDIPDSPINAVFPGIFFRYHINKWGLRIELNYLESNTKSNNELCLDCYKGSSNNNTFEISGGAQYKLTKKMNYLYGFSNIYYKRVNSEGNVTRDIPTIKDSFKLSSDGIGIDYGIGVSLFIRKKIRISPEIGYDICYSKTKNVRSSLVTGEIAKEDNNILNATMKAKLLLTVPF